jgi:hypothetical protein
MRSKGLIRLVYGKLPSRHPVEMTMLIRGSTTQRLRPLPAAAVQYVLVSGDASSPPSVQPLLDGGPSFLH